MKVKYATMIVKDMERSVQFYTEMGFAVDSRFSPAPHVAITLMKGDGDAMVELIKNDVDPVGFYSVGMEVDDVPGIVENLRARGVKILTEPTPIAVGMMAIIEDLNGVRIGLTQHH